MVEQCLSELPRKNLVRIAMLQRRVRVTLHTVQMRVATTATQRHRTPIHQPYAAQLACACAPFVFSSHLYFCPTVFVVSVCVCVLHSLCRSGVWLVGRSLTLVLRHSSPPHQHHQRHRGRNTQHQREKRRAERNKHPPKSTTQKAYTDCDLSAAAAAAFVWSIVRSAPPRRR